MQSRNIIIGLMLVGTIVALEAQMSSNRRGAASHFQTSDRCIACHNGLTARSGEDISIGFDWRPTMMANSARDPYWQAGVRREILDHPQARAAIEGECSICHMPMARFTAHAAGREGEIFSHLPFNPARPTDRLAADGVSCALCHRIEAANLGKRESFIGGFVIDATLKEDEWRAYGPFQVDAGRTAVMRSSSGFRPTEGTHMRQSEVCATCHTLYTKTVTPDGFAKEEFPEQVPYQEWLHSSYNTARSCQSCHMPAISGEAPISSVLGQLHSGVERHTFLGGNFFMQRLFARFGPELAAAAIPQDFSAAAFKTLEHLEKESARLRIERAEFSGGHLRVMVAVENLAGHKLPTAYPSRRAWLNFTVRDRQGNVVFESGAFRPDGSIEGNDNDADGARWEPHYTEITRPDQVQIYEPIMADSAGRVTTGLLQAVRYVKDNRLLPRGFDKQTAPADIAVRGEAANDADFSGGGDRVTYMVETGQARGPFHVQVKLYYQPIGYRWAHNLRSYNAFEPQRFSGYFEALAAGSGAVLAAAETTGGSPE